MAARPRKKICSMLLLSLPGSCFFPALSAVRVSAALLCSTSNSRPPCRVKARSGDDTKRNSLSLLCGR
jgi:hypothetical protein